MSNQALEKIELTKPVIAIVGPTASGKSSLAQELATFLNGEIISADSMQVYRVMNIGTGKVPVSERRVKHWGLDLCSPSETYSVAHFQEYARDCFSRIAARGKRVILCGGTGLYVAAAIDDFHFPKGEQLDNATRSHYMRVAETMGQQHLWNELQKKDPASAELIHPNNVRRVVRAFEMLEEGTSYAQQNANAKSIASIVPAIQIGLRVDPDLLNRKINTRVDEMISLGLVDEVASLLSQGFRESITSPQAIGYKEIVEMLEGNCSLDEAIEAIKLATRRYAKRQRSWFKRDSRIFWIDADTKSTKELLEEALAIIEEQDEKARIENGS
ncbi:MAG: tRNA (adenosine(37)-N6)-dimethylallyltransferase MiaA [Raoultibacter sp.]|jgi:tRNA dimethylallyltransferase